MSIRICQGLREIALKFSSPLRVTSDPFASITGLTNNATFGATAQIASVLTAVGTGGTVTAYQWATTESGDIVAATAAAYTPVAGDDTKNLYCKVTIDGSVYNTAAYIVRYAVPSFSVQPTIAPLTGIPGTTFALTEGVAADTTLTIITFTLDGVDKTGELIGLDWDSTGEVPGEISLRVSASNSGGTTLSNIVLGSLDAAALVPDQFLAGDWSVADKGTGNALTVTISNLPGNGGSPIIDIEYELDASGTWVSSVTSTVGQFDITGLTNSQSYAVAIRAANTVGSGTASTSKSATPTTSATAPSQFGPGDWSVADELSGGTLTLTVITMPSDGGSPITNVEYQLDAGSWVATGLIATGSFDIMGLTDDQSYSVAVRAVNAVGNGAASATKSATPTTSAQEVARWGTTNNAGEADFDTGDSGLNGTDGPVTITAGVITLDSSSPTAGSYSPDGWPVTIATNQHAMATDAQWKRAFDGSIGAVDGKTVYIRYGAELTKLSDWNIAKFYRTDANVTVKADGFSPWETTNFHVAAGVSVDNVRGLAFEGVAFRSLIVKSNATYGYTKNFRTLGCHYGDADPDPNADYSGSGYTQAVGLTVSGESIRGFDCRDNTFRGSSTYLLLFWYSIWGVCRGNAFDLFYHDALRVRGSDPIDLSANIFTRPFSLVTDLPPPNEPHTDPIQYEGGKEVHHTQRANMLVRGNARGKVSADVFAAATPPAYKGIFEGEGISTEGIYGHRITQVDNITVKNIAVLPVPFGAGAVGQNVARLEMGADSGGSGSVLEDSFGGSLAIPGTVVQTNNVDLRTWDEAALDAALADWRFPMDRATFNEALIGFKPIAGQALDGMGPTQIASLATPTTPASQYTLTGRPNPVFSVVSVTPGSNDFSASITSDTKKGAKFWAIFPQGSVPTDRQIKEATTDPLTSALDAGFVSQLATGAQSIVGGSSKLSAGTNYVFASYHEICSNQKSTVQTSAFLTTGAASNYVNQNANSVEVVVAANELPDAQEFTLAAWIKSSGTGTGVHRIAKNGQCWTAYFPSTTEFYVSLKNTAGTKFYEAYYNTVDLLGGKHLILAVDANNVGLWIDGVEQTASNVLVAFTTGNTMDLSPAWDVLSDPGTQSLKADEVGQLIMANASLIDFTDAGTVASSVATMYSGGPVEAFSGLISTPEVALGDTMVLADWNKAGNTTENLGSGADLTRTGAFI